MLKCDICGAPIRQSGDVCDYAVPLDRAPGIGDPARIAAGRQSHSDHEVNIARWRVHHPLEPGATPQVLTWARDRLAREGHVAPPF